MKVLFYYPPMTPRTGFPTWEPLQFIFLARVLREYHIDSSIIDGRLLNGEQLHQVIDREISDKTVCFGITALTCYQLLDALDTARYVKEHYPHIPVIVGGWHATLFPEETLNEQGVDIVVRGQGEKTLPEVLERIAEKRDFQGVPGVSWKRNGRAIHEQDRPLVSPDLLPRLQVSDFEKLELRHYQLDKVLFYMSSVGCPYSCNYCSVNTVCHRKWLPLSAEKVFEEIRGLQNAFGFREVIFWDNVFFANRERVRTLCERFIRENLDIRWSAHARINEIASWEESFLRLIRESGCKSLFIGAESGSQTILDRINKNIRSADIVPALKKLQAHDIATAINWMVGLPGEHYDDIVSTVRCITEGLKVYRYDFSKFKNHVYRFVPFPGTRIFATLSSEAASAFPGTAREWGKFIYEKVNDGLEPWRDENVPSMFASTTFYLWKAYLQQEGPGSAAGRLLKRIAKFRVDNLFFRFPLEWHVWKKLRAHTPSPQVTE